MAGFDDLIRGALEKQGNPTEERRKAIYDSSRQALERMLTNNSSLDTATSNAQRKRLEQAIFNIEKDYAATLPVSAPSPSAVPIPPTAPPPAPMPQSISAPTNVPTSSPTSSPTSTPVAPGAKVAVGVSTATKPTPVTPSKLPPIPSVNSAKSAATSTTQSSTAKKPPTAPVVLPDHLEPQIAVESGVTRLEEYSDTYKGDALKERKSYAKILLWTIILVGLAVAGWWAVTFGPALLKQQFDGSVPNPSNRIESGSFVPDGGEGWISAFAPLDDSQNIDSSGRGTADLFQDGETNFVRLASNSGSTRNTLRIKIPPGIMKTIKGRAATFEMQIKNAGETIHQFAVFCEFSDMGTCGRKRFKVGKKIEPFIFDALINDADLPEGVDAYLAINTDLSTQGKAIDLYSIRIRAGQ